MHGLGKGRMWLPSIMAISIAAAAGAATPASPTASSPAGAAATNSHGFDFEYGRWRVHHRVKRADGTWQEFEGTSETRPMLDGQGNVEENVFFRPTGNTHGVALRAFDPTTGLWAIWWIDGRNPHGPLDPPSKGRFEHGVGRFYADFVVNGQAMKTRLIWSQITARSARWEQASSTDGGRSWDTNWVMTFTRVEP